MRHTIPLLVLLACILLDATAVRAQGAGILRFCNNGKESFSVRDAAHDRKPGFFHQEFGVGDKGSYTVVVQARGFLFDGYAYTRNDSREEWRFLTQAKGVSQFTPRMKTGDSGGLMLIQVVKRGADCPNCPVTMTFVPAQCEARSGGGGGGGSATPPCPRNYCLQFQPFGLSQCVPRRGADGNDCR